MPAHDTINPKRYRQLIAGQWGEAEGGRVFDDMNPYTGGVFAKIPASSANDMAHAIDAAQAAFPAWAAMGARARQALFLNAATVLERRADEIVLLMAHETGSASPFSRFQIQWAVGLLRQAAGYPYLPGGEIVQSDTPGVFAMAVRRPLGVVAGISPWNGAVALGFRTIVAPLACARQHQRAHRGAPARVRGVAARQASLPGFQDNRWRWFRWFFR